MWYASALGTKQYIGAYREIGDFTKDIPLKYGVSIIPINPSFAMVKIEAKLASSRIVTKYVELKHI